MLLLSDVTNFVYVWYALLFLSVYVLVYQLSSRWEAAHYFYHGKCANMINNLQGTATLFRRVTNRIEAVLEKSRLRFGGRSLDKGSLLVISFISGTGVGIFSFRLLDNVLAAILLAFVGFSFPYKVIVWDANFRRRMMIRQTPYFFLTLANFYQANGDVISALDDSAKVLQPPLGRELLWMLRQLKFGFPLGEVIAMMKKRLDSKILREFLDDLELHSRHGGDFQHVLSTYVEAAIEKEAARMERQSETIGTVYVVYFLFAVYLLLLFTMIRYQPQAMSLLTTHIAGKLVVVGMIVITIIVFAFVHAMARIEDD